MLDTIIVRNIKSFLVVFLMATIVSGCVKEKENELSYDTHCNKEKLLNLKGKTLAIILFDFNGNLLKYSTPLKPSTAKIVMDIQKEQLLSQFWPIFKLKDISDNSEILKNNKPTIKEPEVIGKIIKEVNADGGLLITNIYGYKMSSGPLLLAILQALLEKIAPEQFKDMLDFMFGPSSVDSYEFASNTYIVDKDGKVVWNFYGKVSSTPEPFKIFEKPIEFLSDRGVTDFMGMDPSDQAIVKALSIISGQYIKYQTWLILRDFEGNQNKNYLNDYPENKRNKYIVVYPASYKHTGLDLYDAPSIGNKN